ncbi:hypothetical protein [Methylocapsa palsarum]|uniref:GDSL-like Lipase/Acylhydrolase family protein n=1 Tax=Methylocapsa palsarum TaxID=1612308 RepID=A0A1I3YUE5_9HYPH|nr:hypothetical protein [Methylocapsa palsarum]SFK35484.1 hypothetical protein SAMN05444581_106195 [Methylocapsa palsarum]
MRKVPLRLGPLAPDGFIVRRSGIRWLCDDGRLCKAGDIVAYCNLGLGGASVARLVSRAAPFADEARDFQVGFATPVGGRLRRVDESSQGGFLDRMDDFQEWRPDFVIGHIECEGEGASTEPAGDVRLFFAAGRRATGLAEDRSGFLTGWNERSRAWWGEGKGRFGTLLSLGICEQVGVILGDRLPFADLFDAVSGPAHAVFIPDEAQSPCAAVVKEQILRSKTEAGAIAADLAKGMLAGPAVPNASDWIFAGCLLASLGKSPMTDHYDMLTRSGLSRTGPPDAVVLSLMAEGPVVLRHKELGYTVHCVRSRFAGPAFFEWLRSSFEQVKRAPADILNDYRQLIDAARAHGDAKILIMNRMSSSGHEDVFNYAAFDQPLSDTLTTIHAKEMNLMLHDLARESAIGIVDVDAIAADMGGAAHLPDGVHSSGALQAEIRAEILHILDGLGVAGFSAAKPT